MVYHNTSFLYLATSLLSLPRLSVESFDGSRTDAPDKDADLVAGPGGVAVRGRDTRGVPQECDKRVRAVTIRTWLVGGVEGRVETS